MKYRLNFKLLAAFPVGAASALALVLGALPANVSAQTSTKTIRISVGSKGEQVTASTESSSPGALSADGRYVAFRSFATNLVPDDTNNAPDIFVRDSQTKKTVRVSVASDGTQAMNGGSNFAAMSADGRYVSFYSYADNLAPNDTNGVGDIFVHDLRTHQTVRVNVASDGTQANSASSLDFPPQMSDDGRYVAFDSFASNLVPNDTNSAPDVFVHDRQTGTTTRVSVGAGNVEGDSWGSLAPAITADGRFVAFASDSTNLVPNDTNNATDIFVRDRQAGTTERVSLASNGNEGNGVSLRPTISNDGRLVAFENWGSNLVSDDTNGVADIFVRNRQAGTTTRVSESQSAEQGNDQSRYASISGNGRYVAFQSVASNLVSTADTNFDFNVFAKDLQTGKVTREDVTSAGVPGTAYAVRPSLNPDGRFISFDSGSNLVADDTNNGLDVYLHQRF